MPRKKLSRPKKRVVKAKTVKPKAVKPKAKAKGSSKLMSSLPFISKTKNPVVFDANNPNHHRGSKKFHFNQFLSPKERNDGFFTGGLTYDAHKAGVSIGAPFGNPLGQRAPTKPKRKFDTQADFPTATRITRSNQVAGYAPPGVHFEPIQEMPEGRNPHSLDVIKRESNLVSYPAPSRDKGKGKYIPPTLQIANINTLPAPDINPFGLGDTAMQVLTTHPRTNRRNDKSVTLVKSTGGSHTPMEGLINNAPSVRMVDMSYRSPPSSTGSMSSSSRSSLTMDDLISNQPPSKSGIDDLQSLQSGIQNLSVNARGKRRGSVKPTPSPKVIKIAKQRDRNERKKSQRKESRAKPPSKTILDRARKMRELFMSAGSVPEGKQAKKRFDAYVKKHQIKSLPL